MSGVFQRVSHDAYWSRYGRQDYAETEFARALERLPAISATGPWVAGGSVRRLISRLPQDSDFDYFFKDGEQFEAFCADMKERGASETSKSDFNITFNLPAADKLPRLKVQAICIAYYDTLEELLDSFDFSLCQCGFDGSDFVFGQWALFDIASKRLVPGRIRYGASTLRRIIKYTNQGFTICGGGLASILEQVVNDPSIIQREVEYVD